MRRKLFSLAQWAIGIAALVWAMSDVQLPLLWESVKAYSPVAMLPVFACAFADYACMGLRLHRLMPTGTSLSLSVKGCLLAVGMNCLLPAKAGDALKILYLTRNTGQSFVVVSSAIFWERLCDVVFLGSLLVFAMANIDADQVGMSLTMLLVVLCAGILCFFTLRHWSTFFHSLYVRFLPSKLANPLSHLHSCIVDRVSLPWVAGGLAWSLGSWGFYFLSFVFSLQMAGIGLGVPQMLSAFAVSCLGTAIPSLPGGIGLYEGAVVLGLSWYGVDSTQALCFALFFHAVHFLPLAVAAIAINGQAKYSKQTDIACANGQN